MSYRNYLNSFLIFVGIVSSITTFVFVGLSLLRYFEIYGHYSISTGSHSSNKFDDCYLYEYWKPDKQNQLRATQISKIPQWGSYRPGVYFGLKSSLDTLPLSTGIMWSKSLIEGFQFRHGTSQDELRKFEWERHDGRSFGIESLIDSNYNLELNASFIIHQRNDISWSQEVSIGPLTGMLSDSSEGSFVFYMGLDCFESQELDFCLKNSQLRNLEIFSHSVEKAESNEQIISLIGHTYEATHAFSVAIIMEPLENDLTSAGSSPTSISFSGLRSDVHSGTKSILKDHQDQNRRVKSRHEVPLFDDFKNLNGVVPDDASFIALQVSFTRPFRMRVHYFSDLDPSVVSALNEATEEDKKQRRLEAYYSTALLSSDTSLSETSRIFYETALMEKVQEFELRFDTVFQMENEVQPIYKEIGKRVLSSLLGGIGFFEGYPRIGRGQDIGVTSSDHSETPQRPLVFNNRDSSHSNKIRLYSATPSRTSFPRGFLWDEGFHQLLIHHWDPELSLDVISSWLSSMHYPSKEMIDLSGLKVNPLQCKGGWIPREMILGDEAIERVPDEFITQRSNIANPPTLLLALEGLVNRYLSPNANESGTCSDSSLGGFCWDADSFTPVLLDRLVYLYPLLEDWVQWFESSQKSDFPMFESYRWKGRSEGDGKFVPNTLASGLDDYPRSPIPTKDEHHLDLLCWILKSYSIMAFLADTLHSHGRQVGVQPSFLQSRSAHYSQRYSSLRQTLNSYYSEELHGFFDMGLYDENAYFLTEILFRCRDSKTMQTKDIAVPIEQLRNKDFLPDVCPESHPEELYPLSDGQGSYLYRERQVLNQPRLTFVPRLGYVSLYPLLLKLLDPSDMKLGSILDILEDPDQMWSDYGIRSISKKDIFYKKRNSPGDAPYWRGPIWININYLVCSSLNHYSKVEGPFQDRARVMYKKLRRNLMTTIMEEYIRTGFIWEQYFDGEFKDERSGRVLGGVGMRGHPFTGWSSLVLSIMSEKF